MQRVKSVILVFVLSISWITIFSQDFKFTVSVQPKVVRVGEQVQIVYSFNQNINRNNFTLPNFKNFKLIGGPSVGTYAQSQLTNKGFVSTTEYRYTYYLRALNAGKHTIDPAEIKYKNKEYKSNSVAVEVVGSSKSPSKSGDDKTSSTEISTGDDVFIRLVLNKRNAYVGEQIVATVKLYTKVNISSYDRQFTGPQFNGFYKQDVDVPPLRNLNRENVNGEIYHTGVLRKYIIYPQKSGTLTIPAFDLEIALREQVKRRSRDPFDDFFFGSSYRDIPKTLRSKPVSVRVNSLPGKRPSTFTGAVGTFSISSSLNKEKLTTNEAATYRISISGTGNIKLIDEPVLEFPPDLESFDPKTTISRSSDYSGKKTFEYILIPRYAGEYQLPEFEFSYFDIQSKQYKILKTDKFTLHVEKGSEDSTIIVPSGISKEDFKLLNTDILHIKNKPFKLKKANRYFFGQNLFFFGYLATLIVFILLVILRRNHIKRNADVVQVKKRKANKLARKRLNSALSYIKQNNREKFYDEILKALWGYISDKLSIPLADLNKDNAFAELSRRKVNDDLLNELKEMLNNCEYAKFAPVESNDTLDDIYKKTIKLIIKIEQQVKNEG